MARKDVQIKKLFGDLAETDNTEQQSEVQPVEQAATPPLPPPAVETTEEPQDEAAQRRAYRERVDAVHGKPTTIRLRPTTIERVDVVTRRYRVKKGEFYNFAINYFLDRLEEDPTILPVRPAKYEIGPAKS